ncbi:MAG: corrinoid protein [Candidatus Sumerlaeaceae bacterium]|nr:corrinoid protein [Candidatus Sumerlaeaceae bacterium]
MEAQLQELAQAIIDGQRKTAVELTNKLLEAGATPKTILEKGLIAGMNVVGVRFKGGEYFVPEVLVSARSMKACMEILKPLLAQGNVESRGTVVLGTVSGDLHDIGKNLVSMMAEGAGLRVIDLGVDVTADKFVQAAKEHDADVIAMSALLTTTMIYIPKVIDALAEESLRDKVKIIVGGAPVTQEWATSIGADGYAPDAASAVDVLLDLVQQRRASR